MPGVARPAAPLLAALLLCALLCALAPQPPAARAQAPQGRLTAVAAVVPAPLGYSYTLGQGYDVEVYGFQDSRGNYYAYRSYLGTGDFVLVAGAPLATALISPSATIDLKAVEPESLQALYVVSTSSGDYVVYSGGRLYGSDYPIFFASPPTNVPPLQQFVEVFADGAVLPPASNEIVVLAVTHSDMYLDLYVNESGQPAEVGETLASLLGLPPSCFEWFPRPIEQGGAEWLGGLAYSPACISSNVTPEVEVSYEGETYFTAFAARTPYGYINYVIFAYPTVPTLEAIGILHAIGASETYHVLPYGWAYSYLYLVTSYDQPPIPATRLQAVDVSQVAPDGNATCVIPQGSQVIYELLWRYRQLSGLVELMPGEVVLFRYGNRTFFCHGSLSWLEPSAISVSAPKYEGFTYPIEVSAAGAPVLVVESDGKVLYGASVSIPWREYEDNTVFAATGAGVAPLAVSLQPIYTSFAFILGLAIAGVLAASVVLNRPGRHPEYVTLVDDLPEVQPMELTSEEKVRELAAKHVERFGVCPDDVDLAAYHGALPPIPPEGGERLYCPWKVNPETEAAFKEIAALLAEGLFAIVRGRNYSYAYTVVGDSRLILYFYKQEFEASPAEVLRNAVVSLRNSLREARPLGLYFDRPIGFAIFTAPSMRRAVSAELEKLRKLLAAGGEEKAAGALRNYFSEAGLRLDMGAEELAEVAKYLRDALVISTDNVTELVEFLSERVASAAELAARARGDRTLEGLGALA